MKTARMIVDRDYIVDRTDEKLFCSFVEPLGRCIYGGLYEPGHPAADENGFRRDVLSFIKPLNLTMNRFPGGNFTSTFRWEDSIGPKECRPRRAEEDQVLAQGNYVLAVSEGTFCGAPTSYYGLWRIENGKVTEHWDVMETIAEKDTWQNQNGKF